MRYVYVAENNTEIFVNDYFVKNGFAKVSSHSPNIKYQKKFQKSENEAIYNKRGFWVDGVCDNLKDKNKITDKDNKLNLETKKIEQDYCKDNSGDWSSGFIMGVITTVLVIWGYKEYSKKKS